MSECKLDHSAEDVRKKWAEQAPYLPQELSAQLRDYLACELDQITLNELFHLLKKYDLASADERKNRNRLIKDMLER